MSSLTRFSMHALMDNPLRSGSNHTGLNRGVGGEVDLRVVLETLHIIKSIVLRCCEHVKVR